MKTTQASSRQSVLLREKKKYEQVCRQNANNFHAWWNLGRINLELGQYLPAINAFDRALVFKPEHIEVLIGKVIACRQSGDQQAALAGLEHAQRVAPNNSDVLLHKADILNGLGSKQQALALYQRILNLSGLPRNKRFHALSASVVILSRQQRYEEALDAVLMGLALEPESPLMLRNQSTLLIQLRRYEEALAVLDRLEAMGQADFLVLDNKVRTLAALQRFAEAESSYERLRTDHADALREREYDKPGVPIPEDAMVLPYAMPALYLDALLARLSDADWQFRDAALSAASDLAEAAEETGRAFRTDHFRLLSLSDDQGLMSALAEARAKQLKTCMAPLREQLRLTRVSRGAGERLRIGYVSGEFRDHATGHLTRKLFKLHDRARFEIVGYGLQPGDGSVYWRDISNACEHFVDLTEVSNAQAAERIARDGIHILVDLNGYTRYARTEIFALRPAPVQVSYLAYPGTMGADFVDYIIADPIVLPEAQQRFYSERPVYLPDCYQVNDDEQPVADTGITRAEMGLPQEAFVYCCFNAAHKIDPETFSVWMRILQRTPGSVLWLLEKNPLVTRNLRQMAHKHGIDPRRLLFAPAMRKPEHLERHRLADLFLDTFIYNAHTTASDALWAGLPILTRCGDTFPARVCASLLHAIGLPELVTNDARAFEELAVELAADRDRLSGLRMRLEHNRRSCPLFDTKRFVRNLESAYELIWQAEEKGEQVRFLMVEPDN